MQRNLMHDCYLDKRVLDHHCQNRYPHQRPFVGPLQAAGHAPRKTVSVFDRGLTCSVDSSAVPIEMPLTSKLCELRC